MSPIELRHQGCVVSSTNGFVTFDETKVKYCLHTQNKHITTIQRQPNLIILLRNKDAKTLHKWQYTHNL